MKAIIIALALVSAPVFANNPEDFAAKKTSMVQNVDKRIESLNKMKTCLQGAAAMDAVKVCKDTHRTEMHALKDANIDEKIQQLQEKKNRKKTQ